MKRLFLVLHEVGRSEKLQDLGKGTAAVITKVYNNFALVQPHQKAMFWARGNTISQFQLQQLQALHCGHTGDQLRLSYCIQHRVLYSMIQARHPRYKWTTLGPVKPGVSAGYLGDANYELTKLKRETQERSLIG